MFHNLIPYTYKSSSERIPILNPRHDLCGCIKIQPFFKTPHFQFFIPLSSNLPLRYYPPLSPKFIGLDLLQSIHGFHLHHFHLQFLLQQPPHCKIFFHIFGSSTKTQNFSSKCRRFNFFQFYK